MLCVFVCFFAKFPLSEEKDCIWFSSKFTSYCLQLIELSYVISAPVKDMLENYVLCTDSHEPFLFILL